MAQVKETALEIGKAYFYDEDKEDYGIYKGYSKETKSVTFLSVLNTNKYWERPEDGLAYFAHEPDHLWQEV